MTTPSLNDELVAADFMIAELRRFHEEHYTLRSDEFTTLMYAGANGITSDRTKSIINNEIEAGRMIRVGLCGRQVAYRLVK